MGSAERDFGGLDLEGRRGRGRLEKWTRSVLPSGVAVAPAAAAVRSLSDARRGAQHGSAAERGRGRNRLPASAAELGGKKVNLAASAASAAAAVVAVAVFLSPALAISVCDAVSLG